MSRPTCVHSIGVIKKKDSKKVRPLLDSSKPTDHSVNNYMNEVSNKFQYVCIDNVLSQISEGKYYMSNVDLANAYCSVLISPHDRQFFGLEFDGKYYEDNFLCFGCKSAPYIFNRLTDI